MDRGKAQKKDGKVFSLKEPELISGYWLNPEYKIELYAHNRLGDTGRLEVGRLIPCRAGLPEFVFRWDERQDLFDVEIKNADRETEKKFKSDKGGYKGHHPQRAPQQSGRVLSVDIELPGIKVFQGLIKVPVIREEVLDITMHAEVDIIEKYIKKEDSSQ